MKIDGIPITISPWVALLAMLLYWVSLTYIRKTYAGKDNKHYYLASVFALVIIFFSLIAHEAMHAIVARNMGVDIVEAGLTGWGAYVLPAKDLAKTTAVTELLVALAGPLANLALAIIFAIPVKLLGESIPENTLQFISYANYELFWINLLPILVLDGGKVAHSIAWLITGSTSTATDVTSVITVMVVFYFLVLKRKFNLDLGIREKYMGL